MIYAIGLLASAILWLFTLKLILESNKAIPIKIAFIIGILVVPFVGVLYPIYIAIYTNIVRHKSTNFRYFKAFFQQY